MSLIECIPNISEGRDRGGGRGHRGRRPRGAGRPPARRPVRRHPPPLGADVRRRSPGACWPPSSRCSSRRWRGSTCAAITASIRDSVPSTSCRSCRSRARRWPTAWRWRATAGAAVADRFAVPVFLYEEAATTPARRNLEDIRRGEFEGLAAKLTSAGVGARLRSGAAPPECRRHGDWCPHAAHRLQHQPRHRSARRRQAHRRRHPDELGRLPLRQGDGPRARGPRHRAGVDEPDQLREDADLQGVRDRASARPPATA